MKITTYYINTKFDYKDIKRPLPQEIEFFSAPKKLCIGKPLPSNSVQNPLMYTGIPTLVVPIRNGRIQGIELDPENDYECVHRVLDVSYVDEGIPDVYSKRGE